METVLAGQRSGTSRVGRRACRKLCAQEVRWLAFRDGERCEWAARHDECKTWRMTTDKATLTLRERVLEQLTDDETSKVSKAETAKSLTAGDEYLDLEQLAKGVLKADAAPVTMGHALPKKAVQPKTWEAILTMLATNPSTESSTASTR